MNEPRLLVRINSELADLIPSYLENRRNDLRRSLNALRIGDFRCLQRIGHNLKGSAGGYGFNGLAEIGLQLEQAAAKQQMTLISDCLEAFADYLHRLEISCE